ncbi:MAG: efflux transporter outer membrane subunit [Vicinamibacteria bacterium]|jgi:multidrug efflux system outer membrane protein|nr:efflux transporter outer membrane subunit [Vicinamibacteria bacterium]
MRHQRIAWLVGTTLALSGCTMIPQYSRPEAPVPAAFPVAAATQTPSDAPAAQQLRWQDFFTDARLRSVIEQALANNRDLRVATLNIDKYRALYRIQRAELFPALGALANGEKQRIPGRSTDSGEPETSTVFTAAVGVSSWEVDLFGRVRSLKKSALEQYFATEQARRATQIALVAAVAQTYLTVAADMDGLKLSQATLAAQRSSLGLIQRSRDLGVASDLELRQVQSQVEAARADVARYTGLLAVDQSSLQLLVGAPVDPALLPDGLASVAAPRAISAGWPSDVLLTRPDILAAEHQLRSANANIGAARAAFFPRISLTAGIGTVSKELSDLFASGTGTWSFAPQIAAPIYAAGLQMARLKAAKVDREIAVARYEKGIQQAFKEASDALTLRATLVEQKDAQEALVRALADTHRLSEARYQAGLDGYLGVLIAQRSLFAAQQALLGVRLAEQANLVTLYKVLGGGAI